LFELALKGQQAIIAYSSVLLWKVWIQFMKYWYWL
jgi:hypothetical protein